MGVYGWMHEKEKYKTRKRKGNRRKAEAGNGIFLGGGISQGGDEARKDSGRTTRTCMRCGVRCANKGKLYGKVWWERRGNEDNGKGGKRGIKHGAIAGYRPDRAPAGGCKVL